MDRAVEAEDGHVRPIERLREIYGRLAAELDNRRGELDLVVFGERGLVLEDVADALLVQRLEVQPAAGVEIGGNGLRVGVDHNALDALFVERPGGVDRAVVELDALADANGAAADDERLGAGRRLGLVLLLVGAVKVGRERLELRGAGVDHLVHGADVPVLAQAANLLRGHVCQLAHHGVGESQPLRLPHQLAVQVAREQPLFHVGYVLEGAHEPAVYAGAAGQVLRADAFAQLGEQRPQALVAGLQPAFGAGRAAFPQDVTAADFERADRLLEGGLECAVDGHHLAGRLHLRADGAVAGGELVEGPAGYLYDAVVEGRLERGGGLLGYGVGYLVEALAGGYLGGDPGDGVAGGLAGEGGTAADAGVDLDDEVGAVGAAAVGKSLADERARLQGVLHVAAAFDAQCPDYAQAGRAEHLVLLVGKRLAGGHDDAVAGVDAHRVDVFHVADGDAVVGGVAHHLVLDLLPADKGALEQHLAYGAGGEAAADDGLELSLGVGDAAACAAERVGGADDQGQAEVGERGAGLVHRFDDGAGGHRLAQLHEQGAEQLAVFGVANGLQRGAQQPDAVLL